MKTGEAWIHSREKRVQDLAYASAIAPLGIVALSTVGIVANFPLLESPLYRQRRVNGTKSFTILKIRSIPGADYEHNDPSRASRLQRMLRSSRLDEMPQFINILRGDMSLVGPRPLLENEKQAMLEALPSNWHDRWLEAYDNSRPGLISDFVINKACGANYSNPQNLALNRAIDDVTYYERASSIRDGVIITRCISKFPRIFGIDETGSSQMTRKLLELVVERAGEDESCDTDEQYSPGLVS